MDEGKPAESQRVVVLVVDDDDILLRTTRRLLANGGRDVEVAADARAALQLIEQRRFDVIVSDIRMPGLSGIDLLRAVRKTNLDVPVILVSGAPDTQTAMDAIELGAFRYLAKPYDTGVFVSVVDRAVRLGRLAAAKRLAMSLAGHDERFLGDRTSLEARFASALSSMWMAFQPIVSHRRGRSIAYEALLRTDEETLKNPVAFLAAAEQLQRVHELGRAIRVAVAEAAKDAPDDVRFFVNLHPTDLLDGELYQALSPLSAIADRVVLEITERSALDCVTDIEKRIASLRALGFRIAVDDLGAGYSGLSCLTSLEPDIIKLDMSLVRNIDKDRRRQQVVLSLIELCGSLSMAVVVEGIETEAERETLVGLGADMMQGYLFARPARGGGWARSGGG
jgi:EAL domain-containing protein (putative c-di-GMP-specific phosphodiesterase class I)/CheY-like chemotaxis protein